jgi:hypothetical protein
MAKTITKTVKQLPSKDAVLGLLADFLDSYKEQDVSPNEFLKAIEIYNKMQGYNEADKKTIEVTHLEFEVG